MRIGFLMAAAVLATPVMAQTPDRNASRAITAGDLAQAERILVAERRIFPARPELMLNLAAVYRQTGREADAQSLYADVLKRPDILMDLPDGRVASSHTLAEAARQRMSRIASR